MSLVFSSALLVEDERNLAVALQIALRKLNIPTQHAGRLSEARKLLDQALPEFILLDRNLPDGDGLELCEQLRKRNYSGSILVLTASGQIEDRVKGLDLGADDYLPKPFSWEELDARIRALSRRKQGMFKVRTNPLLWEVDSQQLRVHGPKGWVELTPLEFNLVAELIDNEGKIISRKDLLRKVWGFNLMPKTRTVDLFLARLRKYFEQSPENPLHFLTVRGIGYKFQR